MTAREKYIEQTGLFYEKYGLPKMAGRILGYLIISETKYNSFDDVQTALKASKGSISANIHLLLNQNMIEKHMRTGDRKSYYAIAYDSLSNIIEAKVKSVSEFKEIFRKGLELNPDQSSGNYQTLETILKYYEFLEEEIPLLRIKWEDKLKNQE